MDKSPDKKEPDPTPAERLARAKYVVNYLCDQWPAVLRRQSYLQLMSRSDDLRQVLEQTYAAHVQNALLDTLILDLLREIGALVLDDNRRAASVRRVLSSLRDAAVLKVLQSDYMLVPDLPRIYNDDELMPELREAAQQQWYNAERVRNLEEFDRLQGELGRIDAEVLNSDVAAKLWTVRSRGVAHYDVVRDGADWKVWRLGDTGLTYVELDQYVDEVTIAMHTLNMFVRRAAFSFEGSKEIAHKYANEYIDALVIGLGSQRRDREERVKRIRDS